VSSRVGWNVETGRETGRESTNGQQNHHTAPITAVESAVLENNGSATHDGTSCDYTTVAIEGRVLSPMPPHPTPGTVVQVLPPFERVRTEPHGIEKIYSLHSAWNFS
jgi:hypothetical protein